MIDKTGKTQDLANTPIAKLLTQYSLPAIFSMVIISLYHVIAGIFVGQGLGPLAITGLAITFPVFNLVNAFCLLGAAGSAVLCSIEMGRNNLEQTHVVLAQATLIASVNSVLISVIFYIFLDPILIIFGATEASLPYARDYTIVFLIGQPIFFLSITFNHILRASGYPVKALITSLIGMPINIILTPIFIYILDWGMIGVSLAMVIGQSISFIWPFYHFMRKKHLVHFKLAAFKPRIALCNTMLYMGLPPFFVNVCGCLSVIVVNQYAISYGGDLAVAAYGILNRLAMMFGMTVVGLTQGMQPIIGYAFGAKNFSRMQQTLRLGYIVASIMTTFAWLAFQFFSYELSALFTTDKELLEVTANCLRGCTLIFFVVGWQIVISIFFQSVGMAATSSFLSLARQMLCLIPCVMILPHFFGLDGIWYSLPSSDLLATIITAMVLLRTKKHFQTKEQN